MSAKDNYFRFKMTVIVGFFFLVYFKQELLGHDFGVLAIVACNFPYPKLSDARTVELEYPVEYFLAFWGELHTPIKEDSGFAYMWP